MNNLKNNRNKKNFNICELECLAFEREKAFAKM